ncbi:MAG: plasmid pRiA4b ORF-3 family protein [Gammaproteobacteria bacterium]|nr:plasmid pRiA4b ORF-3 family protein [Gammaproteobacteria bacterium]
MGQRNRINNRYIAMYVNQFKRVYQFRIDLKGTKPPIWRRIQVPDNYSFEDLHITIQNAMDWEVYAGSSFEFQVIDPATGLIETIGCSCFGFSRFAGIYEPVIRIADYFSLRNTKAGYTSKHETRWTFTIEFEKELSADEFEIYPICVKGKGASPPEDCGGVDKYQEMLATMNESNSGRDGKAMKLYRDFFEDDFDPAYFDPDDLFFTAGTGNPPLPDGLMKILKNIE